MIQKLINAIKEKDAPIVVGLDPTMSNIPEHLLKNAYGEFGETLEGAAEAIWQYNKALIDAVCDLVPAVKPQIAMYEQFGIPGLSAFNKTVAYSKQKGLVVIGDVKRGDIGSTSAAYATAHIGSVKIGDNEYRAFDEDFMTVNPYFGIDGIKPFVDECNRSDRGLFILVKTSNPSSGEFQDKYIKATDSNGQTVYRTLYDEVARKVNEWAEASMDGDYSNIGAVVGATYPEMGQAVRNLMPKSFILVPGYGAQGGTGADLKPFFNKDGLGAIVNSSRGIIAAYKKEQYSKYGEHGFAEAAREAVLDMKKDINENVK